MGLFLAKKKNTIANKQIRLVKLVLIGKKMSTFRFIVLELVVGSGEPDKRLYSSSFAKFDVSGSSF